MADRLPHGSPENPVFWDWDSAQSSDRRMRNRPYSSEACQPNNTFHRSGEPSLPYSPPPSTSSSSRYAIVPTGHRVGQRKAPRTPSILINDFFDDADNTLGQVELQSPFSSAAGSFDETSQAQERRVFPIPGAYIPEAYGLVRSESRDSNASGYDEIASIAHSSVSGNESFFFDQISTSFITPGTSASPPNKCYPASAPGPLGNVPPLSATSSPFFGPQFTTTSPVTSVTPRFGHSRDSMPAPPPGSIPYNIQGPFSRKSALSAEIAQRQASPVEDAGPEYFDEWSTKLTSDGIHNSFVGFGDIYSSGSKTNYQGGLTPLPECTTSESFDASFDYDIGSFLSSNAHPLDHFSTSAPDYGLAGQAFDLPASWIGSPVPVKISQSHLTVPQESTPSRRQRPRAFSAGSKPIEIPEKSPSRTSGLKKTQNSPAKLKSPVAAGFPGPHSLPSVRAISLPKLAVMGARGKRSGPMKQPAREAAKKTRIDRSICIACKQKKQGCIRTMESPNSPCVNCKQHASKRPGPCSKAFFDDFVTSGALNYISQRAIHHVSKDGSRRACKVLPEEFPLHEVLRTLDGAAGRFDMRVSQGGRSVYVLKLDQCRSYLSRLCDRYAQKGYEPNMTAFIDKELFQVDQRHDNWTSMIADCRASSKEDMLALLLALGDMPSRATYSYVPLARQRTSGLSDHDRNVDPEAVAEEKYLYCAAHLARIIARKVEVEAYAHLQTLCHSAHKLSDPDLVRLLQNIGLLLVSLRWRYAWWGILGDGTVEPEPQREQYEVRVRELCGGLYFWFCSLRRRLPSSLADVLDKLSGVQSRYADTKNSIWETFPERDQESHEGFEKWMAYGRVLVIQAGAATTVHAGSEASLS